MDVLEVKNLSVNFGKQNILRDISFSIEEGDTLAIIGPNGSGKTTLFRAILGAVKYEGEIHKDKEMHFGYVPQKVDLERDLPITVNEFLNLSVVSKKVENISKNLIKMVGLNEDYLNKKIGELSAGELQRVLIAWSLVGQPKLLLFDEPTASVDVAGQETVYELLHKLQDEKNLTLILISHDLSVVYKYANKVLCLNKNQVCFGPPAEVLTPKELEKLYGGERKLYHHKH